MTAWVATIGLEVHVQLDVRTKLLCACPATGDGPPNHRLCPTCAGHPGALPVLSAAAVDRALRAALALGCEVRSWSAFDRKQYFHPDLPKGYQVTQHRHPVATDGWLHLGLEGPRVRIARIQLEEDAGRRVRTDEGWGVDLDRAGVALIEVVTGPDLHTPEAVEATLRTLHRVLVAAGVTRGALEHGHLRCDVNVSVAPEGGPLGERVEVKNVSSFRFAARAVEAEIARQTVILEAGGRVVRETRAWRGDRTVALRDKEDEATYRYLPEPDLPAVRVDAAMRAVAAGALPGVPLDRHLLVEDEAVRVHLREAHGLDEELVGLLVGDPALRGLLEEAVAAGASASAAGRWIRGRVRRRLNQGESCSRLDGTVLARLVHHEARGAPRGLLEAAFDAACDRGEDVDARLGSLPDVREAASEASDAVAGVLRDHPDEVARYHGGDLRLLDFFVGRVMRGTAGRADARHVRSLLVEALDGSARRSG